MEPFESAKLMDRQDTSTRGEPLCRACYGWCFPRSKGTGITIGETAYDMNRSRLVEEAIMVFLGSDEGSP